MGILPHKKSKMQLIAEAKKRRRRLHRRDQESSWVDQLGGFGLLILMIVAITMIAFLGLNPAGPPLLPGQLSRVRVTAQVPFSYTSQVLTQREISERQQQVRPTYRVGLGAFEDFEGQMRRFLAQLNDSLQGQLEAASEADWPRLVRDFVASVPGVEVNWEDVLTLMRRTTPTDRARLVDEAILELRDILRGGIYEPQPYLVGFEGPEASAASQEFSEGGTADGLPGEPRSGPGAGSLFTSPSATPQQLTLSAVEFIGQRSGARTMSEREAAIELRMNLTGIGNDLSVSGALFRMMRRGVQPNLIFDRDRYTENLRRAAQSVAPVTVQIEQGAILIEAGEELSALDIEAVAAYREALLAKEELPGGWNLTLLRRLLLTIFLLSGAALAWKVAFAQRCSQRQLLMACFVLLLSVSVLRLSHSIGDLEFFRSDPLLVATMPFVAPVTLGSMLLALVAGRSPAVLGAIIISIIYSIMRSNLLTLALIAMLSSFVAIYLCRGARLRGHVVRAGLWAGAAAGVAALLNGLLGNLGPVLAGQQAAAALISGLLSGLMAVALLPLIEGIFKAPSDISLLDLTDFNHPLLRSLQMRAPGSYHHSLMVANLSERAAAEIGANSTVCRVTCLFHDIGKVIKPEYFVENQRPGENPHDDLSPSMSALVIKNHVKEGVQLAREARMPKVIIDVIQQHHGTSLIRYFYHRAVQRQRASRGGDSGADLGGDPSAGVDEGAFRYEGPRPRTAESAIILLADSIEAASRAMKKINPQAIEELVDAIIAEKVSDHQLDECPLTMRDLRAVRESFCASLGNMLHGRVAYPEKDAAGGSRQKSETQPPFSMGAAKGASSGLPSALGVEAGAKSGSGIPVKESAGFRDSAPSFKGSGTATLQSVDSVGPASSTGGPFSQVSEAPEQKGPST